MWWMKEMNGYLLDTSCVLGTLWAGGRFILCHRWDCEVYGFGVSATKWGGLLSSGLHDWPGPLKLVQEGTETLNPGKATHTSGVNRAPRMGSCSRVSGAAELGGQAGLAALPCPAVSPTFCPAGVKLWSLPPPSHPQAHKPLQTLTV